MRVSAQAVLRRAAERQPGPNHGPHGLHARVQSGKKTPKRPRGSGVQRTRTAVLGDDAQAALGAEDHLAQVGPAAGGGGIPGASP